MVSLRVISLFLASYLVAGVFADGGSGVAGCKLISIHTPESNAKKSPAACSKQTDCCACDVNAGQQLTCKGKFKPIRLFTECLLNGSSSSQSPQGKPEEPVKPTASRAPTPATRLLALGSGGLKYNVWPEPERQCGPVIAVAL